MFVVISSLIIINIINKINKLNIIIIRFVARTFYINKRNKNEKNAEGLSTLTKFKLTIFLYLIKLDSIVYYILTVSTLISPYFLIFNKKI